MADRREFGDGDASFARADDEEAKHHQPAVNQAIRFSRVKAEARRKKHST